MASRRFAAKTVVPIEKTRGEIERFLKAEGSTGFMYGNTIGLAMIVFDYQGRRIKFAVTMPVVNKGRTNEREVEREEKRRWRCLLLLVRAKFESVNTGIVEFDREFLAHIVIDGNTTVGDQWVAQAKQIVASAKLPPLLGTGDA